jgi:UDP-GlcNAc3NAcA epimerase
MSAQKNLLAATVVGARTQFIKAAVGSGALKKRIHAKGGANPPMHTGQHHNVNISGVLVGGLRMPQRPQPRYWIGTPQRVQTEYMLERFENVLIGEGHDLMLVYVDCSVSAHPNLPSQCD